MVMASSYKLLLDTNFILIPFQFNVDIFEELNRLLDVKYEILIPKKVIEELKNIAESSKGRAKRDARSALEIAKKFEYVEDSGKDADDAIMSLAHEDSIICTNDKVLKRKARNKKIPVIYLRQKNKLEIEGL